MTLTIEKETIRKFDVPGPRYTSYPTAPQWSGEVNESVYIEKLKEFGQTNKTLSLYIHIPFCRSMCTYCACSVVIRPQDEKYGEEYVTHLIKEMDLVAQYMGSKRKIRQLHWGGGTPTYLTESQIEKLFQKTKDAFDIDSSAEMAIEIDPRNVTKEKLRLLRQLGFNRISLGIQDFDITVQKSVNRLQPYETVKSCYDDCRQLGFHSINFDLIYGLPHQTIQTFDETVQKVVEFGPDRIALYSFAYVPWLKKHQSKMNPDELPSHDLKLDIFLHARQKFLQNGYRSIAMDHFAVETDELAKSFDKGTLYRNFMGYTVKPADEYLGLGVTAIGFLQNTFIQNQKILPDYYQSLKNEFLPVERGKILSQHDLIRQWTINSLMCQFQLDKKVFFAKFGFVFDDFFSQEQEHIHYCQEEGLLNLRDDSLTVTELGKIFIRNICMGFDEYLKQQPTYRQFSQTV